MLKKIIFISILSAFIVRCQKADLVIMNAKIWTADSHQSFAEALAVKENRILIVGDNDEIKSKMKRQTMIIDAQGRLVLPGFNDAHLHFISGGQTLMRVDLLGCQDVKEIQSCILSMCQKCSKGTWITGRGWDHTLFNNGNWPDKKSLDNVAMDYPVFIHRVDGHAAWANSLALKIAGITRQTPDPPGGKIVRHAGTGEPTGILLESAMGLLSHVIPPSTEEDMYTAALMALDMAKKYGVTSIQDNSGISRVEIYHRLLQENLLTVRVSEWIIFDLAENPELLMTSIKRYEKYCQEPYIRFGLLKGFVDGTLGSRTAYLFQPYDDDAETSGLLQIEEEKLKQLVCRTDSIGLQIGLHCIGTKANWLALNCFAEALKRNGFRDHRHRIEHAQVLREEDIERFAQLGVIASMQPTHCTSDLRWAEERIGKQRCRGAYAWRSILDKGGRIAFGTDWPVEPLDPMRGIYSAVTRKNPDTKTPAQGWYSEQKLTIEEAIRLYTCECAYAEFQEKEKGSLSPGKLADIIVLSKDVFVIPEEEIPETRVDFTIFDGRVVYTRE
ncbi:amidohydrolase [candidate division KSB1 bacterium]|nr:amidohydrolase [candidate division KSB1 bacterium]